MAWLATLGKKALELLAPQLFAWLTGLVQGWLAKRAAKKAQEQADKDLEESKKTGRPVWRD